MGSHSHSLTTGIAPVALFLVERKGCSPFQEKTGIARLMPKGEDTSGIESPPPKCNVTI